MLNAIPKNWLLTRFKEFLIRVDRRVTLDNSQSYKCVGVRWYGMGAFVREETLGMTINRKQQWAIKEGDIVYNKLFAWKGAFAIADASVNGCIVSDKFPTYVANQELIIPSFLRYYFRLPQLADQAQTLSKGAAAISKLTLNPPQFWDLIIPLPPIEEQQRIMARIEELVAKIEEAHRLRKEAANEATALLNSAMNKLLAQADEKSSWRLGLIAAFAEINPSRAGNVNLSPADLVSFVPMRAVDHITGTIAWPETRPYNEVAKGYTWFKEGDVIFARITPCMQNGKAAIAHNLVNGVGFGSTEFHVIRPGPQIIAEWLYTIVRHKAFRDDAAAHFKGTAGQQRVPQSFLEQKEVLVPPLPEQHQIITYINELVARMDVLKRLQDETATELDALLPSILDRAFKGGL